MRRRYLGILTVLILLWASAVGAEEFGTLTGTVTDSLTGEPLAGVELQLEDTNFGALTDSQGTFRIADIPPGQYVIIVEMYGFKTGRFEAVLIAAGETILDMKLEKIVFYFDRHHSSQPKPPDLQSVAGVVHSIAVNEIYHLPTRGYTEIAALMPGAMQPFGGSNLHNAGISIRATYPDEIGYYVDGIAQRDPATGVPITFIGNNAIHSVKVANNAFDVAYGHSTGGVVDVHTPRPSRKWHGTFEAVTDNLKDKNYDYNVYGATLSGPLTLFSRRLFLGGALELPHRSSAIRNWQGRLRWLLTSLMDFSAGAMGSELDAELFDQTYYFNSEHAPRFTQKNYSAWGKFTHYVSGSTFYSLRANWFSTATEFGDGEYFDDLWAYARPDGNFTYDDSRLFYSGDDPTTLSGRDAEIHTDPQYGYGYITVTDSLGARYDVVVRDERGFVRNGRHREDVDSAFASGEDPWLTDYVVRDEFGIRYADEGYVYEDYQKRKSSHQGFRADFWHQLSARHELTGGFEFAYHTLRYYHHLTPHEVFKDSVVNGVWYDQGGFLNVDHYGYDLFGAESDTLSEGNAARHPYNYSLFLQDKLSLRDLAVFAGARLDVYHSNTKLLRWRGTPLGNPRDEIGDDRLLDPTDFVDAKAQVNLSPRLGIAYVLGKKSVFHLSLGRFVQPPNLGEYYSGWDFLEYRLTSAGYFIAFGNPDLKPQTAIVTELGLRHELSQYAAVEVTGFYKDMENSIGTSRFSVTAGATGRDYYMYVNGGESKIKGLEFQLEVNDQKRFAAQVNFVLLDAEGTYGWPAGQRNIVWTVSESPIITVPHSLERKYNLTTIIDAQTGHRDGPEIGGFYPLANFGLGLVYRAGSGLPYSPMQIYNEVTLANVSPSPDGGVNSKNAPWVYQLDVKLRKEISLGRWSPRQQRKITVYLEVINVFDRKNILDVYQSSGRPDNTGWLETDAGQEWLSNSTTPDWTGLNREQKYNLRQHDPRNYDTPRQVRFGMRVHF